MSSILKEIDINEYELIQKIGRGSFGQVYEAINKKTGEKVAIKTILLINDRKGLIDSLEVHKLNTPGFLKIYGYHINNKNEFHLVMELLKYNLSMHNLRYIRTKGKDENNILNPTIRSKIIFGIATILKTMHEKNVLFNNLKLDKIGLDDNFEPKLLHDLYTEIIKDSTSNNFYGTPLYMAPEKFLSDSNISFPVDVYSFGVMLYNMFESGFRIGKIPINTKTMLVRKITKGERFDKPKIIPEPYWELINKCWNQNPDERPTFPEIVEILKSDKFAIEEFGLKTNLDELHEYQNRIDN